MLVYKFIYIFVYILIKKIDMTTTKQKVKKWEMLISDMTTEEIERRSLLLSMDEQTEENHLFQILLKIEYNIRLIK